MGECFFILCKQHDMPNILCVHLFKRTLSLVSCLALALIMLLAQYENTLMTKLLYSISEVLVLVNLVILLRILTLWLTLDMMLFTLGIWCKPLVMYTPSILSLSDCLMTY